MRARIACMQHPPQDMAETIAQLTEKEKSELARTRRRQALRWYALFVRAGHERKVSELIESLNKKAEALTTDKENPFEVETFVAERNERRKYSDRWVVKPRVVIPGMVFVRMRLIYQKDLYIDHSISGFMFSRTMHEPECIPDWQFYQFRKLLESETDISVETPRQGDTVRILSGQFEGFVGEMIFDGNGNKFQIRLADYAFVISIDASEVVKVPKDSKLELPDVRYR